jgi:hypothetical protein
MVRLTELPQRILSELEEAGSETVSSMMNTVIDPSGATADIEAFKAALSEVVNLNLADIAYFDGEAGRREALTKDDALGLVGGIGERLTFDEERKYWVWKKTEALPEIVATKAGIAKAEQILEERGYQWWRRKE